MIFLLYGRIKCAIILIVNEAIQQLMEIAMKHVKPVPTKFPKDCPKGPWEVQINPARPYCFHIFDRNGNYSHLSEEKNELAAAALIKSAPDLFNALLHIVKNAKLIDDKGVDVKIDGRFFTKAVRALRKAGGG